MTNLANLTGIRDAYFSITARDSGIALELTQFVDPGAVEPLSREALVAEIAQWEPERLADFQKLLNGLEPRVSRPAKGPFGTLARLFGEYANTRTSESPSPPPSRDFSYLPPAFHQHVDQAGHLLYRTNFSDSILRFLSKTPDEDTFNREFYTFSWIRAPGANTIKIEGLRIQIKNQLKEIFIKTKMVLEPKDTEGILVLGPKLEALSVPLAHLYGVLGFNNLTAAEIAASLDLSLPPPESLGVKASDDSKSPLNPSDQRLLEALKRLPGQSAVPIVVTNTDYHADLGKQLALPKEAWITKKIAAQTASIAIVNKVWDHFGVLIPPAVAAYVTVNVSGTDIPLSHIYANINFTRPEKIPPGLERKQAQLPQSAPINVRNLNVSKMLVFHSYFTLIYGPEYSVDDESLDRYWEELDPSLNFRTLTLKGVGAPWVDLRLGHTLQLDPFWIQLSQWYLSNAWSPNDRKFFRNFVQQQIRNLPPDESEILTPTASLSKKMGALDAFLIHRYGPNYPISPSDLDRYLNELDQPGSVRLNTGKDVSYSSLKEAVPNPLAYIKAVLASRNALYRYDNLTWTQKREAMITLYAQLERDGIDIDGWVRMGPGDESGKLRHIVVSSDVVLIETAATLRTLWSEETSSPGIYPVGDPSATRDFAHNILRQWIATESMTYEGILGLRNQSTGNGGQYWKREFREPIYKTEWEGSPIYYRYRDIMDRAGLNSHWAFTEGKEPRTGDADREQAILDLLRNLGVIDVPDTLVAARAYALLHIDSHAAPLELTDMTDRQVEDLVLEEGLTGAVLSLATSPLDLADVLALFDEALVNRFGLDDIVTRFAGLAMAHTEEAAQLRQSFPARGSALTDVLVGLRKESLEPNQLKKLEFTYRRILRGWMDQDSEAALTWITDRLETVPETLKPLFQNLHTYFLGITSDFQTPSTLRTKPYFYQKEAIRYFSMPEHRRGILADEPGMGKSIQAMGVAEATGAKKILWVTTNSNKQTVAEELAKHRQGYDPAKVPSDVIILSGDADILAQQLRNLDGKKYVIVNYEALRNLRTNNPVGYAALKADLDMIILDEAQLVDNRDSDQGKALHALVEEAGAENEDLRLLMASATPVQNRFDRYYNQLSLIDPTEFPATHSGWRNFKARYVDRGAEGLLELHHLLQNYQLRRRKAEVFPEADPTVGLNLQPTALPKKIYSTVEYDMSKEQSELYVMAMGDFDVFVERHEAALFPKLMTDPNALEEKKIKVKTSIFSKLRVLFQILTHPSKFGVTENPRMDELKRRVTGALLKGEKPIVWSHHQEVGDEIGQAMADLSVQLKSDHPALFPEGFETGRFDGSPISKSMVQWNGQDMLRRDKDRNGFQESETSQPRVMNPSLEAGGVGLTLTAGNPSFFYELPLMVTRLIQGEDRNHRVDGRFRRHTLEYNTLIGRLHPEVMARLHKSDPGLHDLLARDGTVEENLHGNLEIMRRQYSLVLDGLASEADLSRAMQKKLLGAVRYTKVDRVVSTRAEPEKDLSELTDEDLEALTDLEGLSEENVEENAGEAASLEMVIAGQFAPGNTAKLLVPRVR